MIALGVGIGFLREPVWVGLVTARTQFVHFERPLGIVLLGLGGFLFIVFQAGVAWRRALRETPGFDLVVDEDCSEDGPRNALETGLLPGCPHWSVFSVKVKNLSDVDVEDVSVSLKSLSPRDGLSMGAPFRYAHTGEQARTIHPAPQPVDKVNIVFICREIPPQDHVLFHMPTSIANRVLQRTQRKGILLVRGKNAPAREKEFALDPDGDPPFRLV